MTSQVRIAVVWISYLAKKHANNAARWRCSSLDFQFSNGWLSGPDIHCDNGFTAFHCDNNRCSR